MSSSNRQEHHIITILWALLLVTLICGCSLIPQIGHKTNRQPTPGITPIVSNYQPARVLQVCFDTKPLVADTLFRSSVSLVADMFDSSIPKINGGTVQVYISYITSKSYLNDAFSFSVPAIGADEQLTLSPTPNPASYNNPYDHANAVATVTSANATALATAQGQWRSNHEQLAAARALVKRYTNRLRSLPNIWDATGEDVGSCLQSAQERMQGFIGKKTIIISSPLAQSASTFPFIDLSGISVEVIFKTCVFVSTQACLASIDTWKQKLLSFGASRVTIHDPQQSQVEPPTF